MIQKYVSVLQRYFVQYLCGFDVAVLKEVVQVGALRVAQLTVLGISRWRGEGDNPKNAYFKGRLKFFWEPEDFARNRYKFTI